MTPPDKPNPTKNKYNVSYSPEDLRKAFHDIRVEGKGIRETCRLYGIPRSTIQDRLSGKRRDAFDSPDPDPGLEDDETKDDEPTVRSERYSLMEDEDWRTRGGSIWNHNTPERVTRVKCRATTCQLVQLVKFMEKHPALAVSHVKPFPGSDQLWMKLADHINQFGPPKTYKQCKTSWRDLRKRAFSMQRGRNKKGAVGRNLYGMAPKIVSLITAAGGWPPPKYFKDKTEDQGEGSGSSSKPAESPPPAPAPVGEETGVIKVERTAGMVVSIDSDEACCGCIDCKDQLVIRVTDKLDSKTNVFNRFTINDGHFENNITVKEEVEERFNQEESEPATTEVEVEQHERSEMFPPADAILADSDVIMAEKNSVLRDINDTLRNFLSEYKTRNSLMRERIDLERARLQFDMEVHRSRLQERQQERQQEKQIQESIKDDSEQTN